MDLISVVVPSFNKGYATRRCIDSVLSQSHRDIEIIVVDDCSTDDTPEIVASRARQDSRVSMLSTALNSGPAAARDLGFRAARGTFVTSVDSDDVYVSADKLAAELSVIQDHQREGREVVAFSKVVFCDFEGNVSGPDLRRIREGDIFDAILARSCFIPRDFMFRRELYERAGGYDLGLKLYEDWDFKLRLARLFPFYCSWVDGYGYVAPNTGLSAARQKAHQSHLDYVFDRHRRCLSPSRAIFVDRGYTATRRAFGLTPSWRKQVCLHLGTSKTGSTAIQSCLHARRQGLGSAGLFAAPRNFASEIASTIALAMGYRGHETRPWLHELPLTRAANWFRNTLERREYEGAVLSSEYLWESLCFFHQDFCRTLSEYRVFAKEVLRLFERFDIRLIVYLRRQDLHFESVLAEYIRSVDYEPERDIFTRFAPFYAYADRLAVWEDFVGRERIVVRPYEPYEGFDSTYDFFRLVGAEVSECEGQGTPKANRSLSRPCFEYLRRVGAHYAAQGDGGRFEALRQRMADAQQKRLPAGGPRGFLSLSQRQRLLDEFSEQNAIVRDRYCPERRSLFSNPTEDYGRPVALDESTVRQIESVIDWRFEHPSLLMSPEVTAQGLFE